MEELITIATFSNATTAQLVKSKLEAEGISCVLIDLNINSILPLGPFGGIKLQVPFSDSFKALDIYMEIQGDSDSLII